MYYIIDMKRTFILILLILINISNSQKFIYASTTKYARIESSTEIFKEPSTNINLDNIICIAEESYFVEIISEFEDFYKVSYNSISGFIKKSHLKEISNTPTTPYPYNIKITISSNCNLRTTPTTKSTVNNVVSTIYTDSEIKFIGRTYGEEAIDFGGSTWYYVCVNGNYGYIYNKYVKNITPIYENKESFTYASPINETIQNPITHTPSLLIIIILSIPLIAVLIILYIPNKPKHTKKTQKFKDFEQY